jgi:hypothetical protein
MEHLPSYPWFFAHGWSGTLMSTPPKTHGVYLCIDVDNLVRSRALVLGFEFR